MSKIEEMANEAIAYIPENEVMDMDGCAYTTIDEVAKTWYMLGAKAVIKEIEMELSALTFEDYVIHSQRCKKVIEEIYLKVQELKK